VKKDSVYPFIATFDEHYGFEKVDNKIVPIHDQKAIDAILEFGHDLKPHAWVKGGDQVDCGPISHHNKNRRLFLENRRLKDDFEAYDRNMHQPINELVKGPKIFHIGNHEDWIADLIEEMPALQGLVSLPDFLGLRSQGWTIKGVGEVSHLGKLHFVHGEHIGSAENKAAKLLRSYARSIVAGHHHSMQSATMTTALDEDEVKMAWLIACLCKRNPSYAQNRPNQWMQGFGWGYVNAVTGRFNFYPTVIVDGVFYANGKTYGAKKFGRTRAAA
jgi:hypothetical protein